MASVALEKVRTELLCSICLHVFTNPVTLDCGHIFCLNCLNGYLKKHPTAAARKVLPCSVCRNETKVPRPEQPIENWGKQLTPSFTIKNLAEEIKTTQSTRENDDNCFLCRGHKETTLAVFWCQDCEITLCEKCSQTHQNIPGNKHHDVIELTEKSKRNKSLKVMCYEHNKPIKLYCRECKKSACGSCGFLEHRKCDDIASVQSVLPEMTSVIAENHHTILERMKDKEQEVSFLTSQLEFVKSKENATLTKISDVEKRMVILLKEVYEKDKDEIRKSAQTEKSALETSINVAKQDLEMHHQNAAILNEVLECGGETNILKKFEVCLTGTLLADDGDVPERDHVTDLDFNIHEETVRRRLSLRSYAYGQAKVTKTDGMLYRTRLVQQIDTQMDEENNTPRLMDIIALRVGDVDTVLVTDGNNEKVKCFYSRTSKSSRLYQSEPMHSVCRFEGSPCGITKLADNKIMVAIEKKFQLVILSVTPELVKNEVIRTQKQYESLCTLNTGLVAAGCHSGVDILNVSGDTVTRVRGFAEQLFAGSYYMNFINFRESVLSRADYLHFNDNSIMTSDKQRESVTCLTSEGDIKWTYTSRSRKPFRPCGVTSTRRGDVIVVDGHSGNVIVLTRSGIHKADILSSATSEIHDPSAVHCDGQGHLYVAEVKGRVWMYKLIEI